LHKPKSTILYFLCQEFFSYIVYRISSFVYRISLNPFILFFVVGRIYPPHYLSYFFTIYDIRYTIYYSIISLTTPALIVRPPSRIAKRSCFSMAIGVISSPVTVTLSPGITISTPSGKVIVPVTSVVLK